MSSTMPVGARDLLRHGSFLFFLSSRSLSRFASQIAAGAPSTEAMTKCAAASGIKGAMNVA